MSDQKSKRELDALTKLYEQANVGLAQESQDLQRQLAERDAAARAGCYNCQSVRALF